MIREPPEAASSSNNTETLTNLIETRSFKDHSVRIAMLDGIPHFSVADICAAMGWPEAAEREIYDPSVPRHAVADVMEAPAAPAAKYLTTPGVWNFVRLMDPGRGQGISRWAKQVSTEFCPQPALGDPRMFLSLTADYSLPEKPYRFSGWRREWYELQSSDDYVNRFPLRRTTTDQRLAAQIEAAEAARLAAIAERTGEVSA